MESARRVTGWATIAAVTMGVPFAAWVGFPLPGSVREPADQTQIFLDASGGGYNLPDRVAEFPEAHIKTVIIELGTPSQIRLVWSGPEKERRPTGPFLASAGTGNACDCDDYETSRLPDSYCTPKGRHIVVGFNDFLPSHIGCQYATWFDSEREIAIHSATPVPNYSASHGCVRVHTATARLIHNNSIAGHTEVFVSGRWSAPPAWAPEYARSAPEGFIEEPTDKPSFF